MENPRRRVFLALALGTALALTALPAAVDASHSWGNYHWARSSNPFNLTLGDNVSSIWDGHLATASSDWSASSVLNTSVVAGGTKPRSCRAQNGKIEVCAARYGNTGWLGVAQIWVSGSHITRCTVKNNDYYFDSPPYNTSPWRQMVMCQEIGHCFGLDHQDENFNNGNLGTCMDYTSDPDGPPSNEHPNAHDYDQLETIYAHLDGAAAASAAINSMPSAMRNLDLSEPAQWGEIAKVGKDGKTAIFELDFGGGNKVFTFVILAAEDGIDLGRPPQSGRPSE